MKDLLSKVYYHFKHTQGLTPFVLMCGRVSGELTHYKR